MVVGKSNFSLRVTSEAISITDIFAVLFFVSVGMLFNFAKISTSWELIIILFFIVLIVKPLVAILVVKYLKEPTKKAIYIGIALGQIGEFSFLLASIASIKYNIFPQQAYNAMILVSIVTITLNTVIYHFLDDILKFLTKKGFLKTNINYEIDTQMENIVKDTRHVIIVGYGPVGKVISNILIKSKIIVVFIESNIENVNKIKDKNIEELKVVYGDATMKEVLLASGILTSEALIISSTFAPAEEIIESAIELNSKIKILMNTSYIKQAKIFRQKNNENLKDIDLRVHSGEGSAALTLAKEVFDIFNLNNFKEEVNNIYNEIISM
jgi:CPA2 family monovalent cation:H+ antiporter-2